MTLETLVTVSEYMVPGFRGFGKRTRFQNEVPDLRKRAKESLILEKFVQQNDRFRQLTISRFANTWLVPEKKPDGN